MLDFNHLIILSANEGILPKTTLPASFIPYNLRFGFRLPTPEHQDAVFAYYFTGFYNVPETFIFYILQA